MADNKDPIEMVRQAQEAAIKAAMEQGQAFFGNIPGFQMPDGIAEHLKAQMEAVMPDNMAEVAATSLSGVDMSTMAQMMQQNMDYARKMAEATRNETIEDTFSSDFLDSILDSEGFEWEVCSENPCRLNHEEEKLLAYGAPLLVYNGENVNAIESEYEANEVRDILESWWDVIDKNSAYETFEWLMNEGHHADADEALSFCLENGFEDTAEDDEVMEKVKYIADYMVLKGYCSDKNMVKSAYAWDLVRAINIARWGYLSGYFDEDEMFDLMKKVAIAVKNNFSSWEEYGISFAFGRGVWHGDEEDCETAWEVVQALLSSENSPWVKMTW